MNKPVFNEQQNRTLELMAEILPEASAEEKMYLLGRMEGYAQARYEAERKKEETEKEAG